LEKWSSVTAAAATKACKTDFSSTAESTVFEIGLAYHRRNGEISLETGMWQV